MSQYPSPYQPPSYMPDYRNAYGSPDVLAAARRAGLLQIVLGGLSLLCGLCIGSVVFAPIEQMAAQQGTTLPPSPIPSMTAVEVMRMVAGVLACGSIFVGLANLVLGFFVRGGCKGWLIASLVFSILVALVLGLIIIDLLVASGTVGAAQAASVLCLIAIPAALLGLLIKWIIAALRSVPQMDAARAQQLAQYWQYQQYQQAYPQGGYGTGYGYGYAAPGYQGQGYAPPGYSAQGYSSQGYSSQGYAAQGNNTPPEAPAPPNLPAPVSSWSPPAPLGPPPDQENFSSQSPGSIGMPSAPPFDRPSDSEPLD